MKLIFPSDSQPPTISLHSKDTFNRLENYVGSSTNRFKAISPLYDDLDISSRTATTASTLPSRFSLPHL